MGGACIVHAATGRFQLFWGKRGREKKKKRVVHIINMSWIVNGTIRKTLYLSHKNKYTRYMAEILSLVDFVGILMYRTLKKKRLKKAFPNIHVCMCVFIIVDMFNKPVLMPTFCGTDLMVQFDLALCMEC